MLIKGIGFVIKTGFRLIILLSLCRGVLSADTVSQCVFGIFEGFCATATTSKGFAPITHKGNIAVFGGKEDRYVRVNPADSGSSISVNDVVMTTPSGLPEKRIKVACVGDSITYGYGIADIHANSYPAQLQVLLGNNYKVGNFGYSGARVSQTSSKPYKNSVQYNNAIAYEPNIVFIALGINDCSVSEWVSNKKVFVDHYKDLIQDFKALPTNPTIYIGTLMPVTLPYEPYLAIHDMMAECSPLIAQVACEEGLPLIDLYAQLNSEENIYAADGLHPDKAGAGYIAQTVYKAITGNHGGLQMPAVFGDHMVVQRNELIPVYGTADVGETLTVSLGGKTCNTIADENGRWRVDLPALTAGGPYTMTVTGNTALTFADVLIGEVWVAAGQSNMALMCSQDTDWATQGPLANHYPNIRLLNRVGEPWTASGDYTQAELNKTTIDMYYTGAWEICSQETASSFSAIAYYFARDIHVATEVPIGIIENAVGGTSMESYMPREALNDPDTYLLLKDWLNASIASVWHRARAEDNLGLWLNGSRDTTMPHHPFEPTFLYDAEMADLMPFAIQGVLWYQGETNAELPDSGVWDPVMNLKLFEGLIRGWRDAWGQGDFPFYYVQLPNLNRDWMQYREMQLQALNTVSNTGMVVTIDVGNPTDVHPAAKQEVGRRLSLWARAKQYGETGLVYSGPLYNGSFVNEGTHLRVGFDHVGGGLEAFGGGALTAFEVSDAYDNWYPATATIDGADVVVYSASCSDPAAIRYAWSPNPDTSGRLINIEGLPASPFRAGDSNVNMDTPIKIGVMD